MPGAEDAGRPIEPEPVEVEEDEGPAPWEPDEPAEPDRGGRPTRKEREERERREHAEEALRQLAKLLPKAIDAIFDYRARRLGDHWKLTVQERTALVNASQPVMEKWVPEWLLAFGDYTDELVLLGVVYFVWAPRSEEDRRRAAEMAKAKTADVDVPGPGESAPAPSAAPAPGPAPAPAAPERGGLLLPRRRGRPRKGAKK